MRMARPRSVELLQSDLGKVAERLPDLLRRVFEVLQPAREVFVEGGHVDVPVPGEVEQHDAFLPLLLGAQRLTQQVSGFHGSPRFRRTAWDRARPLARTPVA